MTKDQARQFLEGLDFCMTHLVRKQKLKGYTRDACPDCVAEHEAAEEARIQQAIAVLRDKPLPPTASLDHWIPYQQGKLPPDNERVYFVSVGFVEKANRSGGKEHCTVGKPLFWRRK